MEQRRRETAAEEDHDNHQGSNHPRPRLKLGHEIGHQAESQPPPPPPQQQPPPPQKCPRCDSVNTKFCYYNNYSLTQPRYFCKTCRRYWTQGGTLRNVPVGGGCRKGKRLKTSSSSSSFATAASGENINNINKNNNSRSLQQAPGHPLLMTTNNELPFSPWGGGGGGAASNSTSLMYPTGGAGTLFCSLAAMHSQSQLGTNQHHLQLGISSSTSTAPGSNNNFLPNIFQGFDFPMSTTLFKTTTHQNMVEKDDQNQEQPFYQGDDQSNFGHHDQSSAARTLNSWNNPSLNFWNNNSTGSTSSSSGMAAPAGSSVNAKQWPNLPGFGSSP